MKFLFNIPLVLSLATFTSAQSSSCYSGSNFSLSLVKECSYNSALGAMKQKIRGDPTCNSTPEDELMAFYGTSTPLEVEAEIISQCARATASSSLRSIDFSDIAGQGEVFDEEFFNGGTYLNLEVQSQLPDGTPVNVLKDDAVFIPETMKNIGGSGLINFPSNYDNFDTCDLRAVSCCWIGDRQANDNNGNCKEPYDVNCVDANPAPNSQVCLNRDVPQEVVEENPKIHCHGFAWASDPMDMSSQFKGNNLFYVSMFDHLYKRGYVKNVPGQPMCGCIEKMPAVVRADCTEVRTFGKYLLKYSVESSSTDISFESVQVNFKTCVGAGGIKNNLEAYYARLVEEGKATSEELLSVQGKLDENCDVLFEKPEKPENVKPGTGEKPENVKPGTGEKPEFVKPVIGKRRLRGM